MVILTSELLLAAGRGTDARKGEKADHLLARTTHFSLEHKRLTALPADVLARIPAATTLYLSENALASIGPGVACLYALQALFVDANNLSTLDECGAPSLNRLVCGNNAIGTVSLALAHAAPALGELRMARQRVPVRFEPGALSVWASSLRVLDVSGCGLEALRPLAALRELRELSAGDNPISSLSDAAETVAALPNLQRLDVRGCTFTTMASSGSVEVGRETLPLGRYRDALIAVSSNSLEWLDGRDVTHAHRAFMAARVARAQRVPAIAAAAASAHQQARARSAAQLRLSSTPAHARDPTILATLMPTISALDLAPRSSAHLSPRRGGVTPVSHPPPSLLGVTPVIRLAGASEAGADAALGAAAGSGGGASGGDDFSGCAPLSGEGDWVDGIGRDDADVPGPGFDDDDRSPIMEGGEGEGALAAGTKPILSARLGREHVAAVRRASGVDEERAAAVAAAPLPPRHEAMAAASHRSANAPSPPRRTPSDLRSTSKFFGGFSTSPDREAARVLRERTVEGIATVRHGKLSLGAAKGRPTLVSA